MANFSDNIPIKIWKKLGPLLMKMFLDILTRFVVSEASSLLIAILWLLGRLGPRCALFLESPWLTIFLGGVVLFSYTINIF